MAPLRASQSGGFSHRSLWLSIPARAQLRVCALRCDDRSARRADPLLPRPLYEPDIAQNAGAMLRTCACFGADAAIIEPAGFRIADSRLRRAGMDYLERRVDRAPRLLDRSSRPGARGRASAGAADDEGRDDAVGFRLRRGDVILVGREFGGRARHVGARPTRASASRSRRRFARSTSASPRRSRSARRCGSWGGCRAPRPRLKALALAGRRERDIDLIARCREVRRGRRNR